MSTEVIVAIAHIFGSVAIYFILGFIWMLIGSVEGEVNRERFDQELSIKLNIPIQDLYNESILKNYENVLKILDEKYSTELFKNRISDFFGMIRTIWQWLGSIVVIIVFVGVCFKTIMGDISTAPFSWWIVGIYLFFSITSFVFSYICKLLTGRFPGESKAQRKHLANWIANNNELLQRARLAQ